MTITVNRVINFNKVTYRLMQSLNLSLLETLKSKFKSRSPGCDTVYCCDRILTFQRRQHGPMKR